MYSVCKKKLKLEHPTYRDINGLVSRTMADVTCGLRFPGQVNGGLRKQAMNLIPFPRLHFFMDSVTPLGAVSERIRNYSVQEATLELFDKESILCEVDPGHGRYMTASAIFRGKVSSSEAEKVLLNHKSKHSSYFFEWIPFNVECSLCDVPPLGEDFGGSLVGNSTAIQTVFKGVTEKCSSMFRKKAFLHWYTAEGMDETELTEAESNANDLVS